MSSKMQLRVSAKAVITDGKGRILMLRESADDEERSKAGQYQFPGGRLDDGETYEDGLKREAMEETGLEVDAIQNPVFLGEWHPTIKGEQLQIIAIFTLCTVKQGVVKLSPEHDKYAWIGIEDRDKYDVMSPDSQALDRALELMK